MGEEFSYDIPTKPIPLEQRQSWLSPAIVYAGCEFTLSVVMVGAGLVGAFRVQQVALLLAIALLITWVGNAITSYIGSKTGLPAGVIARQSFGALQSRILISLILIILGLGWWAIQTAIAANAFCAGFGIDYTTEKLQWALMVIALGIVFMLPAVLGYTSIKIVDYLGVPVGMLIFGLGIYLAIKSYGVEGILNWIPKETMPISTALSTIIGVNVCQWVMISDYARVAKPGWKNAILVPSLVILVGFILMLTGAIMAVGVGSWDIVQVMIILGYPFWAYFLTFLAQWTTQLVNVYSPALAIGNMVNVTERKQQQILTVFVGVLGIVLALAGILERYMNWLLFMSLLFPPIAAIMTTDFFILRKETWEEKQGWNIIATIALICGLIFGYYNQKMALGIPPVQSYIFTAIIYYLLMRIKASIAPDQFTPKHWISH